uniref:Uncharacterized protein n=1 Tax=Rhizophora mucronata TaxID=61149 RepID=A0A2P2R3B2_RHIMU
MFWFILFFFSRVLFLENIG